MQYGQEAPDVLGREVYILDFSFPPDVTKEMIDKSAKFVWLDHHKTAFEGWCEDGERNRCEQSNGKDYILLDNNKSGALLAWEYFNPGYAVPDLAKLIDDRDRWQFKLAGSRELHAGLNSQLFNFSDWHLLTPVGTSDWGRNLADVVSRGRQILSVHNEQIKRSVESAAGCAIHGLKGLAVNTPQHMSEVGNGLAKASGTYGLVWYYDGKTNRANCSLRSIGEYDVSAIAKLFGGGGHKNAAGFNVPLEQMQEFLK
jgi:oligoribonuclease NrnB/cAMP/cGMP phosphodiesterase (DHH superfamily)